MRFRMPCYVTRLCSKIEVQIIPYFNIFFSEDFRFYTRDRRIFYGQSSKDFITKIMTLGKNRYHRYPLHYFYILIFGGPLVSYIFNSPLFPEIGPCFCKYYVWFNESQTKEVSIVHLFLVWNNNSDLTEIIYFQ